MGGSIDVGVLANLVHNHILDGVPVPLKLHGDDPSANLQQRNEQVRERPVIVQQPPLEGPLPDLDSQMPLPSHAPAQEIT